MKIVYSNGRRVYVLDHDGSLIGMAHHEGWVLPDSFQFPIRTIGRQLISQWFIALDQIRRFIPLWNQEPFRLVSRPHKFDRVVQL
jgi:hypothetical protein